MTGDADKFISLTQTGGGTITFSGKDEGKIVGNGHIKIGELIIEDVALVKGLRHNLISIRQLYDKGYEISFKDDEFTGKNKDPSQTFSGKKYGNIYLLDVNSDNVFFLLSIKEKKELLHRKLGHISMKQISKLALKDLARGLPKGKYEISELCNPCSVGKQVKSSFKSINTIATNRTLQLLHVDLFGPM